MAGILGERANDERVKCLRIFSDGDGETHLEDIDITLQPKSFSRTLPLWALRKTFRLHGIISATSLRVRGKRIGTIRRSDCLCSG